MYAIYTLPLDLKTGTSKRLWNFIAESLKEFLDNDVNSNINVNVNSKIHLGFTFSFPVTQNAINHGSLQRWTKGFNINGIVDQDVALTLSEALEMRGLPIEVCAIINDTTGTLVASNFIDPKTQIGLIFGTGCNAAYYERLANIPKLENKLPPDYDPNTLMAINCEWGAFNNKDLPLTKWDEQLDEESPKRDEQIFEQMVPGYYLVRF